MIMQRKIKHLLYGIAVLLLVVAGTDLAKAQNAIDLRINEILVLNESNYVDDFGMHNGWIEIFNSAYSPINIGGCYLTDDLSNPTKYWIPIGDPATIIPPRGYVVFYADQRPARGIFHLNFTLENTETIALFDANGRTKIDELKITQPQKVDVTYGRLTDGGENWDFMEFSTPGANNDHSRKASAGEKFVQMDPYGIGMTMIAMFVVFSALALLYIIYKNIGLFFVQKASKAAKKDLQATIPGKHTKEEGMSGEVNAAIAMALYLYQSELHDEENTVLTIRKVSRNYSPWSSKIYTLRKSPR